MATRLGFTSHGAGRLGRRARTWEDLPSERRQDAVGLCFTQATWGKTEQLKESEKLRQQNRIHREIAFIKKSKEGKKAAKKRELVSPANTDASCSTQSRWKEHKETLQERLERQSKLWAGILETITARDRHWWFNSENRGRLPKSLWEGWSTDEEMKAPSKETATGRYLEVRDLVAARLRRAQDRLVDMQRCKDEPRPRRRRLRHGGSLRTYRRQ